jgi:2-phosphosulfolactate phosphatase
VLAGELGGVGVPRERGAGTLHLVRGDLLAVARAADDDAEAAGIRHDPLGGVGAERDVVVLGVVFVGADVDDLVTLLLESRGQVGLQLEARVVCCQINAHVRESDTLVGVFSQEGYQLRLEWGPEGVDALRDCDVLVVVDVLSFTTSVDLVVGNGGQVRPSRWQPASGKTLRPALLVGSSGLVELPSPNGSNLCFLAAETGAHVLAACLRNASAVAKRAQELGETIGVIPAGERWGLDILNSGPREFGPLRPCVEDYLGAGAVLAALFPAALSGKASPEAQLAAAAFRNTDVATAVRECGSGRELIENGHAADVDLAIEIGVSDAVPVLVEGVLR